MKDVKRMDSRKLRKANFKTKINWDEETKKGKGRNSETELRRQIKAHQGERE